MLDKLTISCDIVHSSDCKCLESEFTSGGSISMTEIEKKIQSSLIIVFKTQHFKRRRRNKIKKRKESINCNWYLDIFTSKNAGTAAK